MHRHWTVVLLAGVVGAARTHAVIGNTGGLSGCRGNLVTPPSGDGRGRCRRGSYDRRTRVMPGEGRSPGSGCASTSRGEEIGVSLVTPEKIRKLQRALYVKAKQEPTGRFRLVGRAHALT